MRIAVTSVVDLERVAHNRLHEFLEVLSEQHEITVFGIQDYWRAKQVQSSLYASGFEKLLARIKIVPYTAKRVSPVLQEALGARNARRLIAEHGPFDVHFDYNTLLSGGAFSKRFAKLGVPTVYDLADDLVAMVRESPQIPKLARPAGGLFAHRALNGNLRRARFVTVINETLATDAGIEPTKTRVLPNGVDTRLFSPDGPDVRARLGLGNAFVLGYVGVLREWVEFDAVLEALRLLRDRKSSTRPIKLLIVGEEGGKQRIVDRARALDIEHDVVFAGTIPYPDVPTYVRAMDVGLIPFNPGKIGANSLPLKLFEYMACGRPVVSTRLPGVQACAGDRATYASTPEEFAIAFGRLAASESDDTTRSNRDWVVGNYGWPSIAAKLDGILRSTRPQ